MLLALFLSPPALRLLLCSLPGFLCTFELLFLGDEVRERTFAAENVTALASDWFTGNLETKIAGAEGEEGLAMEAGG